MLEGPSEINGNSIHRLRRLVDCCDRFEAAWTAGESPRLEDFRSDVPATEWPAVREELEHLRKIYDPEGKANGSGTEDIGSRLSSGAPTDAWVGRGENVETGSIRWQGTDIGHLPIGTVIGDNEILARIGMGGMGVVYRARQRNSKIDRQVALKFIRFDDGRARADGVADEISARFTNETLAAGRFTHDHIVQVYEVGEWRGRPFYSMQLVDGKSLSVLLRDGPLPNKRAALVVEAVARAVGHAHAMQVIHRDLKPQNILLDVDEKPYVTDFGIAKLLEQDETLTHTGQILGSIPYMSPEQASDPKRVREAGDIYSLGATLYETLTGRPPFRAAEPAETMRQVKYDLPVPPRRLNSAISKDLETICLKCLEKDPARRYSTALEMADELRRVLDQVPIRARPISPIGRILRWGRRHPGIVVMLVSILVVASAGFLATVFQLRQTRQALSRLERRSYYDQIDLAAQALAANKNAIAEQQLDRTTESLRGWEYGYLRRLAASQKSNKSSRPASFPTQAGGLYGASFHPEREAKWFATGGRLARVRIWDSSGERPPLDLSEVPAGAYVDDVKWARGPGSNHLAAGTRDGAVHVWDENGGRFSGHRVAIQHEGAVTQLSFHPSGSRLASAGEDGRVLLVDLASRGEPRVIRDGGIAIRAIAYHPGGELLAFGGDDRQVTIWDSSGRGRVLATLSDSIAAIAFSSDHRYLAVGDNRGTIWIWNLFKGDSPRTLSAYFDGVNALAFSPDGSRLASGGADGLVKIWDHVAGRELLKLPGHTDQVDALSFRADGGQLLSVDVDGGILIWDATEWKSQAPPAPDDLMGHTMLIVTLAVSPDGERLASAGSEGDILVWDVPKRRLIVKLLGHKERVNGLAFDSSGRWLASASRDETLRIWDMASFKESARHDAPRGDRLTSVAFRPSEQLVAFVGTKGQVMLWDCIEGHQPSLVGAHQDEAYSVAYHPDARRLATAGAEGVIRLWDTQSGGLLEEFHEHSKHIDSLSFSPDGVLLASGSHDKTVSVRNLQTSMSHVIGRHEGRIWRVSFSGNSRLLASAASDGAVKVWDVEKQQQAAILLGHSSRVYGLVFDPQGRYLASASGDFLVKLWDPRAWDPAWK